MLDQSLEPKNKEKSGTIRLAGVYRESIVDGPGLRFAIYGQGCPHNCLACHNPKTHPMAGGKETEITKILEEIEKNPILRGVTFSGGEPFCQVEGFLELAKKIKERNQINNRKLDIVIYTGYTYEELCKMSVDRPAVKELMEQAELIIDGRFDINQRDLTLKFRGSGNQRIIHIPSTIKKGEIVLAKY